MLLLACLACLAFFFPFFLPSFSLSFFSSSSFFFLFIFSPFFFPPETLMPLSVNISACIPSHRGLLVSHSSLIYDFQASEKPVSKEMDCIPENESQGYPVDTHMHPSQPNTYIQIHRHTCKNGNLACSIILALLRLRHEACMN